MDESVRKDTLDKEVFDYLKGKCPEFLHSYYVLSKFYETMTNNFDHKVQKNGKIILTPKPIKDESH